MTRGDDLAKDMSRYLIDQIERHPRVTVLTRSEVREVREVHGDGELRSVVVENNKTGERQEIPARALFVFIGAVPNTAWLRGTIQLDEKGFVPTGPAAMYTNGDG